ncbi:flavodoxin [Candidatus Bathyarchaeota archaeon A05DMB-2]|jgi:flavodoxin|nr:flavodoxin [Candidatus Bathyarchaeota archaeon A05DMB-2]
MKSLVVYYSRSGNTRFVAEQIAKEIGGDIEEIIDKKKRKGLLGFVLSGYDATRGRGTKIEPMKRSPKDYDLVVVGTPMWNKRITPAVRTYLKGNDFSGKRVALFCTSLGSESERVFKTLKELMPGSSFVGEITISNAKKDREKTEEKITEWAKSLIV